MHTKFEFNEMLSCSLTCTRTHLRAYITTKIAYMNSGDLKTHKCIKISKSMFFIITILSLRGICLKSESKTNKKK